ncbi:hypothetical protein WS91_14320 [Burkholderia sp. MSMB1498]|nr:hypothetical protein WS91_14320 [Burkholderia sp. MSMB1498]
MARGASCRSSGAEGERGEGVDVARGRRFCDGDSAGRIGRIEYIEYIGHVRCIGRIEHVGHVGHVEHVERA